MGVVTGIGRTATVIARPLRNQTSRWWREALFVRATDATDAVSGRRLMVLAPHPDDETFGCGAVIARARAAGHQVTVVVATDGRHSSPSAVLEPLPLAQLRTAELHRACKQLGVESADVVQLSREDGTLGGCLWPLAAELAALIAQRQPEIIFLPCAQDIHPDHQALHQALRHALRRDAAAGPRGPQGRLVLAYPIWTWLSGPWFLEAGRPQQRTLISWAMRQMRSRQWVRVRCGQYLEAKRSAIQEYASQTTNLTGEPTWSYLPAEAVSLFLQPHEIFLPAAGWRPG